MCYLIGGVHWYGNLGIVFLVTQIGIKPLPIRMYKTQCVVLKWTRISIIISILAKTHIVCHRYIRLLILSLRLAMRTVFNMLIGFTTRLMQSNNFFKISTLLNLRLAHPLRVGLHPALPLHIVLEHITLAGHVVNSSS
ncbi:uncharacterized protein LOC114272554 [Camellia sinensis]|uniref:uncharacterized protein LOC114272554 n=1 Tax=Camellia sinensis TaxID=4442 RepID=UPI001036EB22|nr:uncharacterized protein LOC114272554 [Camellia sinensis]